MQTKATVAMLVVMLLNLLSCTQGLAQKEPASSVSFSANADFVSSYIWRGLDMGHTPSFQPELSVSWRNFTIGTWSAFRLTGNGDDEVDFYLSKNIGPVSLSVWDYWSYSKSNPSRFLNYNDKTTSHLLEGQVLLSGGEKLPFNLLGSYFFYGSDPSRSMYLELQYVQPIRNAELICFAGYQPKGSYYADKASFVNIGATYTQPLGISGKCSLDLLLSLSANPADKSLFFTVGLSLYNNNQQQ